MKPATLLALLPLLAATALARAEPIGSVDTAFKLIGPDHKIVVDAYDDPKVGGVACYVSRAKTGGIKGAIGLAEDKAEASIACRQVGPIVIRQPLPAQEEVFSERISLVFKRLRIVRMVDVPRNTLVYLTYSDRLIDGSPQNSITAVPVGRETVIPVKR
ncbi:MAG: CreA family protein [Roseateles sp.]|uniref:CreA family protein n=1 Tax=Roseateles sp. TaxID=1971397 RepID=UPI0040367181